MFLKQLTVIIMLRSLVSDVWSFVCLIKVVRYYPGAPADHFYLPCSDEEELSGERGVRWRGRAASQLIRTRSALSDHMLELLLCVGVFKHWLYPDPSSNPDLRRTELSLDVALQRTSSNGSSSSSTPSSQGGSQPGSSERNQPRRECLPLFGFVFLSFCIE